MADPLSIAASAIAVAGAGAKLAETLYSFIDNVRKAEKHLRPIAQHIELTSAVLDNVGSLLRTEEIKALCQGKLLDSTQKALDGCRGVYDELEQYLKGLIKAKKDGTQGLRSWDKAVWSYRQKEIDVLQAHLERFKSSLDLVLSVLNLISSSRNHQISATEMSALKADVSKLIKAELEATARDTAASAQSASEPSGAQTASMVATNAATYRTIQAGQTSGAGLGHNASPESHSVTAGETSRTLMMLPQDQNLRIARVSTSTHLVKQQVQEAHLSHHDDHDQELLRHLNECAEAVATLSSSIETAAKLWQSYKRYERFCTAPAFDHVQRSIKRLHTFEAGFEPCPKRRRVPDTAKEPNEQIEFQGEHPDPIADCRSRQLQSQERQALLCFVEHALTCKRCSDVYKIYQRGERICLTGRRLAAEITSRVWYTGKGVFVASRESDLFVAVELGPQYSLAMDLLRAIARFGEPHVEKHGGRRARSHHRDDSLSRGMAEAEGLELGPKARRKPMDQSFPDNEEGDDGDAGAGEKLYSQAERGQDEEVCEDATVVGSDLGLLDVEENLAPSESLTPLSSDDLRGYLGEKSERSNSSMNYSKRGDLPGPQGRKGDSTVAYKAPPEAPSDSTVLPGNMLQPVEGEGKPAIEINSIERSTDQPERDRQAIRHHHIIPERLCGLQGSPRRGPVETTPSVGEESFPDLNQAGSPDQMSPPEISIDYAPPPGHSMDSQPAEDGEVSSPPIRGKSRNRIRTDSGPFAATPSPVINLQDLLSARVGADPTARLDRNKRAHDSSDQRDYILDLAIPERSPANSGDTSGRIQKHPATFQCTLCPKRFTRAYNLRSHLRTHTDEKPFVCTVCGKAFARQHHRERHEDLHRSDNGAHEGEWAGENVALDRVAAVGADRQDLAAVDDLLRSWTLLDV